MKQFYTFLLFTMLFCLQLNAQSSNYIFSQSVGTYTPITGGTVLSTTFDDEMFTVTLPTAFTFNGVSVTSVRVAGNGFIALGTTTFSNTTSPLSSSTTATGIITALGMDLVYNGAGAEMRWEQLGNEIIFQWKDAKRYNSPAFTDENFSFQIRMNTLTGQINIIYDAPTSVNASISKIPQVGLRGSTNSDYNARRLTTSVPDATPSWDDTTVATSNAHNVRFTSTSPAAFPDSGRTFTWTPPTPCTGAPLAGTLNGTIQNVCTGTTPSTIVATGLESGISGITLQWEESDDNGVTDTWANAVGGTGATTSSYTPPSFLGNSIYYRLKVTCTNSSQSSTTSSFNIAPSASPAVGSSSIIATTTTNSTLTFSWTIGNANRRYVVVNTTNSFTDPVNGTTGPAAAATLYAGSGEQVVYDGTGNSVTVTGLTCNTSYYIRVYEYLRCGTTPNFDYYYNTSTSSDNPKVLITSQPLLVSLPATNNFTGFTGSNLATVFPGWIEATGATSPSGTSSSWTNSSVFTETTAAINLYTNTKNEWIISPAVNINANSRLKFKAAITDYNSANVDASGMQGTDDKVLVMVSTDVCGTTWTPLYTFEASNTTTLTNVLTDYIVSLNSYVGQTIQIAFKAQDGPTDDTPDYDFHIGSIVIENLPACDTPTALVASNITATSATINWNAPTVPPANGYEYVYSTTNTPPTGSGTANATTSVNLTSLSLDTTYYVWVRSICGVGNESGWTTATSFYTGPCIPASTSNLTYIDNFSTTNGNMNITNLASGYATSGYQNNYTTMGVTEFVNGSFDVNAVIVGGTVGMAIWVDWNKDLTFDVSEVVYSTTSYSSGPFNTSITIPSTTIPDDYRMRVMIDYNDSNPGDDSACGYGGTRGEVEDYKLTILAQPTDAIDFANLQALVANSSVVSTIETCQTVDVYTQGWEDGVTNASSTAPGAGIEVWIGKSDTDTDPSTWAANTWTVATYNVDAGNNDEFKVSYTGLPVGNHYFASRWRLNDGPFKYGATNNGFWDATTNPNAVLAVTAPVAITTTADNSSICINGSATLTATSTNTNYTYVWDDIAATTGETLIVSPTQTTTYTVTGTNSLTNCTTTSSIIVVVNPLPATPSITASNNTVCGNEIVTLTSASNDIVTFLDEGFETTVPPAGWLSYIGTNGLGTGFNWSSSTTAYAGSKAAFVRYENVTGGNAEDWLVTPMIDLANVSSPSLSFYTRQSFSTDYGSTYYVKVSTTSQTDISTFTDAATWTETTLNAAYNVYEQKTVDLSAYVGQQIYLAFVMSNDDGDSWFIDDVKVNANTQNNITWSPITNLYTDPAATIAYVANTPATTVYYKSATATTETITTTATSNATCESTDSTTITVNVTAAPTAIDQTFCNSATVNDLSANGTGLIWYDVSTNGTALDTSTALSSTTYYVSQTLNGCESPRIAVQVTVNVTAAPTGDALQSFSVDVLSDATVANLVASGTNIIWYASSADALAGTNPLSSTDQIFNGNTYYATQTINGCTSISTLDVTVTVTLGNQGFDLSKLKYYPNPVVDNVAISYSNAISTVEIYNLVGQKVMVMKPNASAFEINMSSLQAGAYFIQLESEGLVQRIKLIKK